MRTPQQLTPWIIVWMVVAVAVCLLGALIAHGWIQWLMQIVR